MSRVASIEKLKESNATSNVISRDLAMELYDMTGDESLGHLLGVIGDSVIITKSMMRRMFRHKGGRPRMTEPPDLLLLSEEEKLRHYNRVKQRESRARRGV